MEIQIITNMPRPGNESLKVEISKKEVKKYWFCQFNPKRFRTDDYLNDFLLKGIYSDVIQKECEKNIKVGDVVYIWRSNGGVKGSGGSSHEARWRPCLIKCPIAF